MIEDKIAIFLEIFRPDNISLVGREEYIMRKKQIYVIAATVSVCLICILLVTYILSKKEELGPSRSEDKLYITSQYKDKIYESCVTGEQFERMPSWDPLEERQPPLLPGRAVQLAQSAFEQLVSKNERSNWLIQYVMLKHFDDVWPPKSYEDAGKQKWYYVVHFWNKTNPTTAVTNPAIVSKQEHFNIIVLMNGEFCKLVPRESENKSSEPVAPTD